METGAIAFMNVNVIPMDSERILTDQIVIVRDGIIARMGPSPSIQPPTDAYVIDAQGQFLMPGLADMHVHLREEHYLLLMLANGVTTVRNMAGTPQILEWRAQIAAGSRLGPQIFTAGPFLDEVPMYDEYNKEFETPEGAARVVAAQKALGYDFIKVYDGLRPSSYLNIVRAAQSVNMPVVGHAPDAMTIGQVLAAGQRSIEHLDGYFGIYAEELPAAIALTVEKEVWNCPTLIMLQRFEAIGGPCTEVQQEILAYVPEWVRDSWYLPKDFPEHGYEYAATHAAYCQLVRNLHEAGAHLLLGTDAPEPCAAPGFSVYHELQNLADCGLTPFEALQTATVEAARFLRRRDELGTVAPGQRADLILLAANPLEDVRNVRQQVGVMVHGQWFSRAQIEMMLAELVRPEDTRGWHR
ncbi:MAG: amidohydrolase family protein [Caldilineaceae bacterium]